MRRRNELEEMVTWVRRYCQHYDPGGITMLGGVEPSGRCKAGVVYRRQFGSDERGLFNRICCIDGGKRSEEEQLALCSKWLRSTRKEGEDRFRAFEESMARLKSVLPVVAVWRKKPPYGKAEVIECPACGGRLHLSQAAVNGHVHGNCETGGCVSWME